MKYIKVILFAAVLFTVSGCKTQTSNIPVDPYLNVNVDFVKANCVPDEQYSHEFSHVVEHIESINIPRV